jgi:release factor glutamine methyltransferase
MRLRDLSAAARASLVAAGIPDAEAALDAELLIRHVLEWDRTAWLTRRDQPASAEVTEAFDALVARRAAREPVAYLRGVQEFFGRAFAVGPGALIPRPETELVVEEGLAALARVATPRILDIGTGSGCLAVTLALERAEAQVEASDVSAAALAWAQSNAERFGVSARVAFTLAGGTTGGSGPFDLVVSNPPYVRVADAASLQPEVARYEPAVALFAGDDGLDVIRIVVPEARAALRDGGSLVMEIGIGQSDEASSVARRAGFADVRVRDDLQGIPRVLVATT